MGQDSILNTIKKALGIVEDNTDFDVDVLLHINSCLGTLQQLGVGPADGFQITDSSATWADFLSQGPVSQVGLVRAYMYTTVRLAFDPPPTKFSIEAMQKLHDEYEWRLNVNREGTAWIDPDPTSTALEEALLNDSSDPNQHRCCLD